MIKIACIGTAGRNEDGNKLTTTVYTQMYGQLISDLQIWDGAEIMLVSGGAAYADALAVRAYLDHFVPNLTLHLPAEFKNSKYIETGDKMSPGRIANWYHFKFQQKTGVAGLIQIQKAIDEDAIVTVSSGFHARNTLVADVDVVIAWTFGTHSSLNIQDASEAGLKDGGTLDTWNKSKAPIKIHHNLHELL